MQVILPTFFWFKYTCVMSWVIIVLSTVTACLNIAALTSCNDIRNQAPHLCPMRAYQHRPPCLPTGLRCTDL